MKLGWQPRKWLEKKAKRDIRGYPVGTIAFYGPDNRRATKPAAGIVLAPQSEPAELRRWFAETGDVRTDETVFAEMATFLREHEVQSVAMTEGILGCPHEEGIDSRDFRTEVDPRSHWRGRDACHAKAVSGRARSTRSRSRGECTDERGWGGHVAAVVAQFIDVLALQTHRFGQSALRQAHRLHEFFDQDFADARRLEAPRRYRDYRRLVTSFA